MPTIHDLVRAIAQREGVEAVVILGRDGLPIESHTGNGLDGEHLAALTPAIARAAEDLGRAGGRGGLVTSLLEYERGVAVLTTASTQALLLVLVHSSTSVGPLLYDLRRHRANIASLL